MAAARNHRQADRVINRREHADDKQPGGDLDRVLRLAGGDGGEADADEKNHHHAFAAPPVGQPAGGQGEQSESHQARRRVRDQLGVAQAPLPGQYQGGHRREDQHE